MSFSIIVFLTFIITMIKLQPTATNDDYMRWFYKVEAFINELKGTIIILGDINLNSASINIINYYCYFLSFCNLAEKNYVPNVNGGMLDIVLVQESENNLEASVIPMDGLVPPDAYHPPLDIVVKTFAVHYSHHIEPSNINHRKDWNFKKCDYKLLSGLLSEASWCEVLQSDDVQKSTDIFYKIIYDIFDICIPKKRRSNTLTKRYPVWFSFDIIQDLKRKLKLHSTWLQNKTAKSYKAFSDLRASLKDRIGCAHDSYLKTVEENIASNPRGFWQHIASLRTKGGFEPDITHEGITFSGVEASEAFARFFASVFLPDMPQLDADSINRSDKTSTSSYVNIFDIHLNEVASGIRNLKAGSAIGPDNIPPWVLKQGLKFFVYPLGHIFNLALKTSTYPKQWKLSRVTPVPKSSKKSSVEEYRPIAVLSTPAKVFESVVHKEITRQIEQYLSNEQHGFRKKRSVNTNLLIIVDYIAARLDRRSQVDVLYFDFQKAFDRVNNDLLLVKLSALGFAPGLLSFIADYLRERQQYVRLGMYESTPYHTRSGVSQGSILGPLLFILMINDLPAIIRHAKCLLYADDLKLYTEIKSEEDCLALQSDVDAVYRWSVANRMEFNISKCRVMTFGRMRQPVEFQYKLDANNITRSTIMKDLGVTFDRKLTFHDHVATVAKESFRRLGFILRNCRDFGNDHVIRLLFGALVRSRLEASSCVWHPHESTYALMLEKIQKAFLRFLYKRQYGYYPYMYPTQFLLGCLGYNSLEVRRANDQLVTICKILLGKIDSPDLHNDLLRFFVPNNYNRSRRHRLFALPSCRTVARTRSPIPRSLAALNALLSTRPDFDIFADEWKMILSECLVFCEKSVCVHSTINI